MFDLGDVRHRVPFAGAIAQKTMRFKNRRLPARGVVEPPIETCHEGASGKQLYEMISMLEERSVGGRCSVLPMLKRAVVMN